MNLTTPVTNKKFVSGFMSHTPFPPTPIPNTKSTQPTTDYTIVHKQTPTEKRFLSDEGAQLLIEKQAWECLTELGYTGRVIACKDLILIGETLAKKAKTKSKNKAHIHIDTLYYFEEI